MGRLTKIGCEGGDSTLKNLNCILVLSSSQFSILGVTEILCSLRLVLEGKMGKEIPESSRLEFLDRFSANNFALSDAEYNISRPLNREGIANSPLLRTLVTICQKSQELSFREVMDSFVLLVYASLAASRTLLQLLLACLNLPLDSEELFCWHSTSSSTSS